MKIDFGTQIDGTYVRVCVRASVRIHDKTSDEVIVKWPLTRSIKVSAPITQHYTHTHTHTHTCTRSHNWLCLDCSIWPQVRPPFRSRERSHQHRHKSSWHRCADVWNWRSDSRGKYGSLLLCNVLCCSVLYCDICVCVCVCVCVWVYEFGRVW